MKRFVLFLVFLLVVSLAITACDKAQDSSTNTNRDGNEQVKNNDKIYENKDKDITEKNDLSEKQELRVVLTDELPNLDPQLCTDIVALEILQDTLEGLIRLDQDGTVKKGSGMAKDWNISEDGKVYTFHLRDAVWSDGVPVTAEDFEYSWKRLLNPKTESKNAFIAYDIENAKEYSEGDIIDPEKVGIKAIDQKTLEVRLKAPNSIFVSKLQHSSFLPARKDLIKEHGDRYAAEAHLVPSCGPFMIEEWGHRSGIRHGSPNLVLVKNPLYWDVDVVKLEEILFIDCRFSSSIMAMYITEQIDYQIIPSQFIEQYRNTDEMKVCYDGSAYYYVFNTENKYVSSSKIRKALRLAIDQNKVYETLAFGTIDSAYAFVPPGIIGYNGKTFREIAGMNLFDDIGTGATKEEIKALVEEGLEEQGMTLDDIQGKINYLTGESDSALRYAELYQEMIEEHTGIRIGIEQSPSIVRQRKRNDGDFTFVGAGWIADFNDAMTFMDLFLSESPYNYANFSNEEYDTYITKAMKSYDPKVRIDLMVEAEKILIDVMPIAPRSYGTKKYVQQPYVKNIVRLPFQVHNGKKWSYVLKH